MYVIFFRNYIDMIDCLNKDFFGCVISRDDNLLRIIISHCLNHEWKRNLPKECILLNPTIEQWHSGNHQNNPYFS